ncbi:MAG: YwiC-like family protein [Chloroflexi bacterium]|nr:YwiC-like family protein [Chloroflexota bacterium]
MNENFQQTYLRRHIALPGEHGAWVFILSPLLIGLFSAGVWSLAQATLVVAAMSAFLLRQPVTIAVKAYSGRRARRDLPAARFWMLVYGLISLAAVSLLAAQGHAEILLLALPGVPVFLWHLYLVSRRAERRQVGVEVVGSGVLALAAPAALWVGLGEPAPWGWTLFGLCWLQSAASIVYAYLRLEQRELPATPPLPARLRMARRALLYTSFNFILTAALSVAALIPPLLFAPFALQWAETLYGSFSPALGYKPARIGFRQLTVSSLFTILFILAEIAA